MAFLYTLQCRRIALGPINPKPKDTEQALGSQYEAALGYLHDKSGGFPKLAAWGFEPLGVPVIGSIILWDLYWGGPLHKTEHQQGLRRRSTDNRRGFDKNWRKSSPTCRRSP